MATDRSDEKPVKPVFRSNDRLHGKKTLKVNNFLDEFEKDDVKRYVDIVDLFNHFGVELKKAGNRYKGKCPWHNDTNPSLSVDREKGLFNCFGCDAGGDIFDLTEKMKNVDFKGALKYLKAFRGVGIPQSTASGAAHKHEETHLPDAAQDAANLSAPDKGNGNGKGTSTDEVKQETAAAGPAVSLNTVMNYYRKKLYESPKALEYLTKRGLENVANYERFKLGFADGTLIDVIGEGQKHQLKELGVLRENGSEHFLNCIVFPVLDELDAVVGMYGRSIIDASKLPHVYIKGKHKGVFNRKASKVYDEVILTESIIDALSLVELGLENVQSIYGTNGFTDEHLYTLKDDRVKTVVLAFDSDDAGNRAALSLKEKLVSEGFRVKMLVPSSIQPGTSFKDWNEYLQQSADGAAIKQAIAGAEVFEKAASPADTFTVTSDASHYAFSFNGITYRVNGVKEMFVNNLRVNVKAECNNEKYFDNLDLYSARSRKNYAENLSRTLGREAVRVEKDLIEILEYFERERDKSLRMTGASDEIVITAEERELGMNLLTDPHLFERVIADMETAGYVGEDMNKLLLFLAACSRKLDDPISVLIISQSAAGKSMLVDTVKRLIPPEDAISATSLSDQALNYVGDMIHKFLVLGEAVHGPEIEHQLREMQSAHELSRLVTMKDPKTGRMETRAMKSKAIVSCVMTSTSNSINPENASRSFIIAADESPEQTRRIHEAQKKKYSLERYDAKKDIIPRIEKTYHAAGRLLEKVAVVNPFAQYIQFPDKLMRTRRDHERFQDLIAVIAFVRQFQKEKFMHNGMDCVECDLEDYRWAMQILSAALASTLLEIPLSVIDFFDDLRAFAREQAAEKGIKASEVSMTQREIREYTGLGQVMVKRYMRMLVEYEYVVVVRGATNRTKGYYRIRDDEAIKHVDLSMIPSAEEMEKLIKTNEKGKSGSSGSNWV
ncbi:MAG TPA: CHC2 zinc finger domain-containing protein [Spirochaetota bacterium]|nr:CHC2 zinc finger domain-containing protein [Spirochaetota bacterium]HQF10598.1 CHC2 zinc finger domain-containing protein [Spirochaetota bacterium]HQJ73140.1 CHC2 zinc finger domain-containing protein [Spirochaetota bacterium]